MDKNNRDKVLVLLVDYNTSEMVPDVIKSINEDEVEISILLIDNGSSEKYSRQLQKIDDSRVHQVRLEKNIGFLGGNNFGLKYALNNMHDFEYVFFLNTDAFITDNLISGLKKILDTNKNAACISPKIFSKDGHTWYGGAKLDFKKGRVTSSIEIDAENPHLFYKVDVFNSCAVLFRTEMFIEAGMLNEDLFMYYDEADCSLKLRKLGYDILYTPQFTMLHYVSITSTNTSYTKTYYMTRNKFILFNNTMTLKAKMYYLAHEFAYHLKHKRIKNAFYHLKGFLDYKKGKFGRLN
jgi:GT2 family glycosyltransferase